MRTSNLKPWIFSWLWQPQISHHGYLLGHENLKSQTIDIFVVVRTSNLRQVFKPLLTRRPIPSATKLAVGMTVVAALIYTNWTKQNSLRYTYNLSIKSKQVFKKLVCSLRYGEWDGRGMWHAWERREKCTRFWWESPKETDHSEDRGVDGIWMDLRETGCGSVERIQMTQDRDWLVRYLAS
jgi:hypothetical protein